MVKCSKVVKLLTLFLSIILGGVIGYFTYDIPISQTLMKFRIATCVLAFLLVLLSVVGKQLIYKFNINEELVLDDDMEDYFLDLGKKFTSNIIIGILIGILLLVATFIGNYHMPIMPYVCGIFYFVILFVYVFPLFDTLGTIIAMSVNYYRNVN